MPSDLPKSGDEVEIRAKLVTSGRTLGFASAQFVGSDGRILASGTHHKYLPMDAMNKYWNTIFSPYLEPLALGFMAGHAKTSRDADPDRGSHSPFDSIEELLSCEEDADRDLCVVPGKFCGNQGVRSRWLYRHAWR